MQPTVAQFERQMAILRLTKLKSNEPVRVNFDNVAFYKAKGENTEITLVSPNYHEHGGFEGRQG